MKSLSRFTKFTLFSNWKILYPEWLLKLCTVFNWKRRDSPLDILQTDFKGKKSALKRVSLTAKYTVVCWGKISISTKDSCPNQITSKVKWSALYHIFALVENASNRQTKDLERVQKQRARVWGSHPSGKNFTPALRFTRLVILYPDLLSTKSIKELGTRLRALQREGFLEKKHRTVQ